MTIDSTQVAGRRVLKYQTLLDVLADAEHLARSDARMLGNWSLGQVFRHLSIAINGSIDGFSFRLSWPERLFIRLFLKHRLITRAIPPGLGRSATWKSVQPEAIPVEEGLDQLRAALSRFQQETKRSPHPALGTLTPDEWMQFHLRHAELHLSFALPAPFPPSAS